MSILASLKDASVSAASIGDRVTGIVAAFSGKDITNETDKAQIISDITVQQTAIQGDSFAGLVPDEQSDLLGKVGALLALLDQI